MYSISFKLVPWFKRKSYKCSKVYKWRTKNADWKTGSNKTPYWLRWHKRKKSFFFYFIPVNIKSIDTYFINGSQIFLKSYLHVYLTYQNSLFRYWPLVSSHSALKDLSESATKTVAFFLLQCPHKLYWSSALNVSSKRTDVIFLVKPWMENFIQSVILMWFHILWQWMSNLHG